MKEKLKHIIITILTWEARAVLGRHKPKIVAITGSLGKTGTKDAVAAALGARYSVRKSPKSFNSEFGVPLTILGLKNAWNNPFKWIINIIYGFLKIFFGTYEDVLVLEIGADKPGDIASVAKWLKSDVVIITAVPEVPVHVEFYKDAHAVLREKASLINSLKQGGTLIIGEDERVRSLLNDNLSSKYTILTIGFDENATVQIQNSNIVYQEDGVILGMKMQVMLKNDLGSQIEEILLTGILGTHVSYAQAFALATASALDVDLRNAVDELEVVIPTPGRMRLLSGIGESTIIDDSYNSSPAALHAALKTLGSLDVHGKKIAIIGDMRELGEMSNIEHRRAGTQAAHIVDELYTIGPEAQRLAESAIAEGLDKSVVHSYQTHEAKTVGKVVSQILQKGDVVLVKSSQGQLRLEKAVKEMMLDQSMASELLVRQEQEWAKR